MRRVSLQPQTHAHKEQRVSALERKRAAREAERNRLLQKLIDDARANRQARSLLSARLETAVYQACKAPSCYFAFKRASRKARRLAEQSKVQAVKDIAARFASVLSDQPLKSILKKDGEQIQSVAQFHAVVASVKKLPSEVEEIEDLHQTLTTIEKHQQDLCPICMNDVKELECDLMILKCTHVTCSECWFEWSKCHETCPLCRAAQ
eukprot:m.131328 g.131328  ORF g.131328 m.131328 type:complete len:207 (-) comp13914_c0_seq18:1856-2476(-)